ncbi:MAG: nucleotidyltransferase family protein [Phycisphaerales bacterium]|nr:MAG: nucleotidyltransferase family protein [Phycisphaerales bacterium]
MQTKNLTNHRLGQVDVVILCGGLGSRLAGVVGDHPKPMAPIDRRPFLDILIDYFSSFGFRRFVLCTGHRSQSIQEHYGARGNSLEFVISDERAALGTAGAVKNAEVFIESNPFLVANGDSFCPMDLVEFYDFHLKKRAVMSMAVVESENRKDAGRVAIDDCQRIVGFEEKGHRERGGVNAGIYFFQREMLSLIPTNTNYSLEYGLFPKLVGSGSFAYICREPLIDIGTPSRYERAKQYFGCNNAAVSERRVGMEP